MAQLYDCRDAFAAVRCAAPGTGANLPVAAISVFDAAGGALRAQRAVDAVAVVRLRAVFGAADLGVRRRVAGGVARGAGAIAAHGRRAVLVTFFASRQPCVDVDLWRRALTQHALRRRPIAVIGRAAARDREQTERSQKRAANRSGQR